MDPRLRIHNAVLGLAHPNPPWPCPLGELDYRLRRAEQPLGGGAGKVVADLIFVAPERSAILVVECKDGSLQQEQAKRYAALTALDVLQTGSITVPRPDEATLDVVIAVDSSKFDATASAASKISSSLLVVGVGGAIKFATGEADDALLTPLLGTEIDVDPRSIPRLLLVDDASDPLVLIPGISNELHSAIQAGRESVTVASLIEASCWGWASFGKAFQNKLRRSLMPVLSAAEKADLKGLIVVEKVGPQSDGVVRLLPQENSAATQAGELRAARSIRQKLDAFVARATGRPVPSILGQMELDLEEAVEEEGSQ